MLGTVTVVAVAPDLNMTEDIKLSEIVSGSVTVKLAISAYLVSVLSASVMLGDVSVLVVMVVLFAFLPISFICDSVNGSYV